MPRVYGRKECMFTGCTSPHSALGYCRIHYERYRKHGDPTIVKIGRPTHLPPDERFWGRVNKQGVPWQGTRCWEWRGYLAEDGYGLFSPHHHNVPAHRFAYESLIGPIPVGLQLDHLCRNRACVNPSHLEPVTARTNQLRGIGPPATNARKTHCPQGHPYDLPNTNWYKNHRRCRTCMRIREYARNHPPG